MSAVRLARAAIKIPKRIERGPTDILKALASTIKPSEIDTNLLDDPYLSITRPNDAVRYSLSKISGKNTAKFILDKHPELFYRDDAEPKISAFNPPEKFSEGMKFSAEDLKWCIESQDPVNGLVVYRSLVEEGKIIDSELLLSFFEMICYTNEDPILDTLEQQKLYYTSERIARLWKKNGLASKIFDETKHLDPPRVFSSMIAGLSKHREYGMATTLFEDFIEAHPNEGLYLESYQCLLASVVHHSSSNESAHSAMKKITDHMELHGVAPNLLVINSIMEILAKFNIDQDGCRTAFQLINDLKTLNLEASLYTYANLFMIMFRSKEIMKNLNLVNELLSYISKTNQSTIQDERDLEFLIKSMNLFGSRMHNLNLASKIFKIFLKNPNLFPNSSTKFSFFDIYFKLMINTEKLETIMLFYDTYVPNQFRPNSDSYDALAEALDLFQADEVTIRRIGKDVIKFGLGDKMKNDAIFRKDPHYVDELETQMELKYKRNMGDSARQ